MRLPSFWWFQAVGWGCFYLLCVLVVLPYVRRPWELGYQDTTGLLADQGLVCLACFLASLALRPVCHSLVQRFLSWIALEVRAAGWSLAIGTFMALVISRFTLAKPEPVELLEACAKTSVLLFLSCNLYFSIKQSQRHSQDREKLLRAEAETLDQNGREYFPFHGADRATNPGGACRRRGVDLRSRRLRGATHTKRYSFVARDHEFSGTKAGPSGICPYSSFQNH